MNGRLFNNTLLSGLLIIIQLGVSAQGYQGQGPNPVVPTVDLPTIKQWKGTWSFDEDAVFFSNDFDGARLNGVAMDSSNAYSIVISAENEPINPSPWYGFKVWAKDTREIKLKLTYNSSRSRYYPKVSRDGLNFSPLDTSRYEAVGLGDGKYGIGAAPEQIIISVKVDENPTWITAQELYTSTRVKEWQDSIADNDFVLVDELGASKEGRMMYVSSIGNPNAKKAMMIISRQHPPEVTGFLAMKSFIETISGDTKQAKKFRKEIVTYVVPIMNPDGVDNGHWRHSTGGIDLNRDWHNFNQPETQNVRSFLQSKEEEGYEFVFGADFHSTWDDIYYPLDSSITQPEDWIVHEWIQSISERLPQKRTNVSASKKLEPTMVSRNYFYKNHGMPAIVFELGDNTPRPFLREKGEVAAEELMRILLERD